MGFKVKGVANGFSPSKAPADELRDNGLSTVGGLLLEGDDVVGPDSKYCVGLGVVEGDGRPLSGEVANAPSSKTVIGVIANGDTGLNGLSDIHWIGLGVDSRDG